MLLDRLCLFRTRSQAAKACTLGQVRLGDRVARSSALVRAGDRITIEDPNLRIEREVRISALPLRRVSKEEARRGYELLEQRPLLDAWYDALGDAAEDSADDPPEGTP